METIMRPGAAICAFILAILLAVPAQAGDASRWRGGWLVTPEEAAQPKARALIPTKSDPGGPRVTVRRPGIAVEIKPPVTIDIAFEPQDGARVDLGSLKVTYMSLFDVDITERLQPYLNPTGIHAEDADIPPGQHTIEIAIRDAAGRRSVERLSFRVLE